MSETKTGRTRVITYRAAYHAPTVALCAEHAANPPWPLGPVEHGQHWGACYVCTGRLAARRARSAAIAAGSYEIKPAESR